MKKMWAVLLSIVIVCSCYRALTYYFELQDDEDHAGSEAQMFPGLADIVFIGDVEIPDHNPPYRKSEYAWDLAYPAGYFERRIDINGEEFICKYDGHGYCRILRDNGYTGFGNE